MSSFITMKYGAHATYATGSWQEYCHEIWIGFWTGMGHVYKIFLEMPYYYLMSWMGKASHSKTEGAAGTGSGSGSSTTTSIQPARDDTLKVVGVGFGRTGTYSLKLALEELGMPTLHTQHLYEAENEPIFEMWTDQIFRPSLQTGKADLGHPDLSKITQQGYQATMDFPTALYWEQILKEYPDCKFILTTRSDSDVWFRSWESMTTSISTPAHLGGMFLTGVQRYSIYLRWLFAVVNHDDSYLTATFPKTRQIASQAKRSYEEHNAKIRATIPSDRLLEYSVQEGWQPLCTFLQIGPQDCPSDRPFPKTNSIRSVQVQSWSSTVVPAVIVLMIVFTLASKLFYRLTGKSVGQWIQYQTTVLPYVLRKTILPQDKNQEYKKHDGDNVIMDHKDVVYATMRKV